MRPCPTDDASEAMRDAHAAAEQVERLLDRYWGDAGADADMIREWRERLIALAFEITRKLGEPKERCPVSGGLFSRSLLDLYAKHRG